MMYSIVVRAVFFSKQCKQELIMGAKPTKPAFFQMGSVIDVPLNATFVTSCNRAYVPGVLKLYASMQRVRTYYPLKCMCTTDVTDEQYKILQRAGIATVRVPYVQNPYKSKWNEAFVKLLVWDWTQYDRVCWVDSDTLFLQNCDELLTLPVEGAGIAAALDQEEWGDCHDVPAFDMLQTGVFVARPSKKTYRAMIDKLGKLPSRDGGDQGFLTSYFQQNNFRTTLFLSSKYNYMKRGLLRHKAYDLSRIKILHFVGNPKPWNGGQKGYEKLQILWDKEGT